MKKAYLSVTLTVLCSATLGTCITALAASRPDPLLASYTSAVPQASATDGRRSLPMLQTIWGQWTSNSGRVRTSKLGQTPQVAQVYPTRIEQTARMQTPLNWLNAMTLKLTANRHVLTEVLDMTGHNLSSEGLNEHRSQPQK